MQNFTFHSITDRRQAPLVAREPPNVTGPGFTRFALTSGMEHRSLALPLDRYPTMSGFAEADDAYLEVRDNANISSASVLDVLRRNSN